MPTTLSGTSTPKASDQNQHRGIATGEAAKLSIGIPAMDQSPQRKIVS